MDVQHDAARPSGYQKRYALNFDGIDGSGCPAKRVCFVSDFALPSSIIMSLLLIEIEFTSLPAQASLRCAATVE